MLEPEDTRRVADVETLKAVAHPLRIRLLRALRDSGPATASELARRFSESSGSTSYHLRQLERYGFVEDEPDQPAGRKRRWRAVHQYTSWSNTELARTPEGAHVAAWMRARHRASNHEIAEAFEKEIEDWGPDWLEAAGQSDTEAWLTPATVLKLQKAIHALVTEHAKADADAQDAVRVHTYFAAYPTRETQR